MLHHIVLSLYRFILTISAIRKSLKHSDLSHCNCRLFTICEIETSEDLCVSTSVGDDSDQLFCCCSKAIESSKTADEEEKKKRRNEVVAMMQLLTLNGVL